jgi:hypothetical protein
MIYIPSIERWVTIRAYINAVNAARANPETEFKTGLTCWWPCKGKEIVEQFWQGVQARINENKPYITRGN